MHRLFDALGVERFTRNGEVHVDFGKHLGVGVGAGGLDVGHAVGDLLSAFAQDVHHVKCRTAAQSEQQHFHGSYTEVFAA